jgi:hypothetical protein
MSRYDWGREQPGIDRLRTQVGEAREVVLKHPVQRRPDTLPEAPEHLPHPS